MRSLAGVGQFNSLMLQLGRETSQIELVSNEARLEQFGRVWLKFERCRADSAKLRRSSAEVVPRSANFGFASTFPSELDIVRFYVARFRE